MSVPLRRDRQKELFSKDLIFGRRPQDLLENRHLLSEPEASEPVADSPKIILLSATSVSRIPLLAGLFEDEWVVKFYLNQFYLR